MNLIDLPAALKKEIQSESKDFIIQNKSYKNKSSISSILFGVFWLGFTLFFFFGFFGEILKGGTAHFTVNGKPATADLEHLDALLIPGVILLVFSLVGIGITYSGFKKFKTKGAIFVSTPSKLAFQYNKEINSLSWKNFSDEIEIQKDAILLNFNKKKVINLYNNKEITNPEKLIINGLENPNKIKQICLQRIEENR